MVSSSTPPATTRTASTMNLVTVIKIGGAAITDKTSFETVNAQGVQQAAHCIAQVVRRLNNNHNNGKCIVVHGAGSFGHITAKRYGLSSSQIQSFQHHDGDEVVTPTASDDSCVITTTTTTTTTAQLQQGIVSTRVSVLKLNALVVEELTNAGVLAVGMSPLSMGWWTDNNDTNTNTTLMMVAIERALQSGFTPVLHGDVMLMNDSSSSSSSSNQTTRVRILSGDEIVFLLAQYFRDTVKCISFLTDVDGVFDADPKQYNAKLLRRIMIDDDSNVKDTNSSNNNNSECTALFHDVTGAMLGKLQYAKKIANVIGNNVRISNSSNANTNVVSCLPQALPEDWIGTEIVGR